MAIVILTAMALAVPTHAQESPLAQLPADTSVVVHLHGIERTKDRLLAFLKNALPDLAPMIQTQLDEILKNGIEGRKFNGLNKDGPHFLFLTELPMPGAGGQPKLAIALRLNNYQDFVKGFLKEEEFKALKPTENGYDVTTMDNEETYFIDRKDYVLFTPNKDLAGQLAKKGPGLDGKLNKDVAKKLLNADVSAYVDMKAVNKEFGGQIQGFRQLFEAGFAQAGDQIGKANAEMIKTVMDAIFQFIDDGAGILLSAEFRPEGLAVQVQARVGEDSKTNSFFKSAKKSSFENLGRLPAGQLAYTGMSLGGLNFKIFQLMTQGALDEDAKHIKEAIGNLEKSGPELWIGTYQMPLEGIQVTRYQDPAKASGAQLQLLQGLKEGESFMNLALKSKPEVKPDAESFKDFKLHFASLVWDFEKTMENQGGKQLPEEMRKQMAESVKKLMGDSAKFWFGTDGKSYVQITAKDWQAAQALLNQFLDEKAGVMNQKAYQDSRKQLPAETTWIAMVDALPYVQKTGDYLSSIMKAMPLPFPIPNLPAMKGDTAYLGTAITLESGYGGMDFWVPATAVKQIGKLAMAAMGKQ
jgi:hypothetical protein